MSADDDIRKASEQFYAGLNRMGNGEAGALAGIWSHGAAVTALHPIGGRQVGWDAVGASFDGVASLASDATIALEEQLIQVAGDMAYEVGVERGQFKMAGHPVRLEHRSVSRVHATVLRWNDRLELRDEGSRFGTELNGQAIHLAFLDPGDVITLGKVKLTCEREPPPRETERGPLGAARVDPELFETLVELHHPSVATGLVQLLHEAARPERVEAEARRFAPADELNGYLAQVRQAWHVRAEAARKLLPRLLGQAASDPAGWRQLLATRRSQLPPQVTPWGWPGG